MGINYNTKTVQDGLVLCLDAGNTRSYPGLLTARILVVGGGGAGGFGHGAGGGGGAVMYHPAYALTQSTAYPITIGAGGPSETTNAMTSPGSSTTAFGVTATGGGYGGSEYLNGSFAAGGPGANGGGGSYNSTAGGTGTAPSAAGWTVYAGNNGGTGGPGTVDYYPCGGGGGAGQAGVSPPIALSKGGDGGNGILNNINGSDLYWGGGGGGASYNGGATFPGGNGGLGGGGGAGAQLGSAGMGGGSALNTGGNGTSGSNGAGGAGGANTGGGGGGGGNEDGVSGAGGSGVVIVRYAGPVKATGGTITTVGTDTVHTFTTDGTFTYTPSWLDTSSSMTDGAFLNGPTYTTVSGIPQIVFDGTNDVWKSAGATPTTLQGNSSFTVFGFFRRTATITSEGSWAIGSGVSLQGICNWCSTASNDISIDIWGNTTYNSGQTYPLNSWVGVHWTKSAGVFSRANVSIYVGTTKYTGGALSIARGLETNTPAINNAGIFVGNIENSGSYAPAINIGYFAVYNRVLSDAEVAQNYNALRGRFGL